MERFTKEETGENSWTARGRGFSGFINLELGSSVPVWVMPSALAAMSEAGGGGGGRGEWWHLKDEDGSISMPAIYTMALMLGVDSEDWAGEDLCDDEVTRLFYSKSPAPYIIPRAFFAQELLAAANNHPKREQWIKGDYEKRDDLRDREHALSRIWSKKPYKTWEDLSNEARDYLTEGIRLYGSNSLSDAAKLLLEVEPAMPREESGRKGKRKYRQLEKHEVDTLEAIRDAAQEAWEVPTQDAVWKIWKEKNAHQQGSVRTRFDKNLKRLGFGWLPAKKPKRGKSAHGPTTSGKAPRLPKNFGI